MADKSLSFNVFGRAVTSGFERAAAQVQLLSNRISSLKDERVNVKVDVDKTALSRLNKETSSIRKGLDAVYDSAQSAASAVGKGLSNAFSLVQSVAGPALMIGVVFVAVKLIGVVITLTGVLAGLAAGLTAMAAIAAAAFGVFAVVAIPTVMKLMKAVQGGDKEINKLPKSMQGAAKAIQSLKKSFNDFVKPLEGPISDLVRRFAALGQSILPKLSPIVQGMTASFSNLISKIDGGLKSTEMLSFFNMLQERGPRIFNNLGTAAGNFGLGLVSIVNTLAPFAETLSVKIGNVAAKFREWAASVQGTNAIQRFISWTKTEGKKAFDGIKDFAKDLPDLFKKLASKDIQSDLHNLATAAKAVASAVEGISTAFDKVSGAAKFAKDAIQGWIDIKDVLQGKKSWTEVRGDIQEGNPDKPKTKGKPGPAAPAPAAQGFGLGSLNTQKMVTSAQAAARAIQQGFSVAFNQVKSVVAAAMGAATSAVSAAANAISATATGLASRVASGLSSLWGAVVPAVSSAFNTARSVVSSAASSVSSGVSGMVSSVAGSLGSLVGYAISAGSGFASGIASGASRASSAMATAVGAIKSAVSSVSSGAFSAGAKVGHMLADGIRSAIGVVEGAAKGLAGAVQRFIPNSPVKAGPLMALNNGRSGKLVASMLADGIVRGTPRAASAASALARGVAGQLGSSSIGGGGYGRSSGPAVVVNATVQSPVDVDILAARIGFGVRSEAWG